MGEKNLWKIHTHLLFMTYIAYVFAGVFKQITLAYKKPKTTFPRNNLEKRKFELKWAQAI